MPQLYSVEQVANRLGLNVRTVRGYIREGRLSAVRIGKQYRIAAEDLEHPPDPLRAEPRARGAVEGQLSLVCRSSGSGSVGGEARIVPDFKSTDIDMAPHRSRFDGHRLRDSDGCVRSIVVIRIEQFG